MKYLGSSFFYGDSLFSDKPCLVISYQLDVDDSTEQFIPNFEKTLVKDFPKINLAPNTDSIASGELSEFGQCLFRLVSFSFWRMNLYGNEIILTNR